jgi:hypothetical protein
MTKLKHSFINTTEDNDDDNEREVQHLTSKNAANMIDDHGYMNKMHYSQHHFDEIIPNRTRNTQHPSTTLPKPEDLTEYLIYYLDKFLLYTNKKKKLRPSGYWRYVIGVYKNLFLSFYFNWVVVFTSPLSSLAFILTYPIISGLLFSFEIGLKIFMDFLGGASLVKRISLDYGNGNSL